MCSYSDSTSDLDEELPVFDFLQPGRGLSQSSKGHTEKPDMADAEEAARFTSVKDNARAHMGKADVMMISSDSEEDAPHVPLAQRLKQRRDNAISASSAVTNGGDAGQKSPSSLATLQLPCQNGLPKSEPPLGYRQVSHGASGGPEEAADLPRRWPSTNPPRSVVGSADATPTQGKPAKRTAEEMQGSREEALRRRQARERRQGDKEVLRLEQERLKAERKALAEAAKALRPEECIKHMVVAVDPDDGVCEPEACVVMQMTVDDFSSLIHSYIQEERHGGSDSGPTLTSWVQQRQGCNPGKNLSLVVIDMEKYFRSKKSQSQKRLRVAVANEEQGGGKARKRRKNGGAEALPEVSRVEVEEALVHLQLHTGVSVRFLPTWKDFSDYITMTTKAVAEAPFKREREKTGFSFYLESEWAGGQRVDKAGKGLLQVWKRQIQQFNRVSPDMAAAILAAYPSPQLLKKAYGLCKTDREKLSLLSDLLIRRGEGVTSTTRRVGPELSKRLFLMMSSCDPELTLDSTV
ncbi:hypothetical protein F2P81_021917 [Scophthalmus maximus]|uniref:ERCC4 domain-containing protein n=1 Tax=Scophthalmus maximus TaxID=52904 RepID=A0A6A4RQU8_SCOMX|nr:hypothetical protein F2P81_021917 [Scophthalmus maximus]